MTLLEKLGTLTIWEIIFGLILPLIGIGCSIYAIKGLRDLREHQYTHTELPDALDDADADILRHELYRRE